jgi:hypothetical protein
MHKSENGAPGEFGLVRKISPKLGFETPKIPARSEFLHRLRYASLVLNAQRMQTLFLV